MGREALGRSRGGLSTKIHLVADGRCRPIAGILSPVVRRRAPSAPGGWVYEAHLMVLGPGYAAPATRARRTRAAGLGRVGGVDGNVSNLSVVSFPATLDPVDGPVQATRITATETDRA